MPLIFVLFALFASVFTISKIGLHYVEPLFFVGTRMLIAGCILLTWQFTYAPETLRVRRQHWRSLLLLAFFNIYLANAMEFWGLKYLTSAKTCFIYSLSPFVAACLSYLILNESMTLRKWVGLGVGFLGFLPIILTRTDSEAPMIYLGVFSLPELAVVVAAVSSSYGWILLRQLVKNSEYNLLTINGYSMVGGGCLALLQSWFVESWHPVPVSDTMRFTACTIALIIISNVLAYNLYGFLLKKFTATFISFAGFSTPLFTALYGWIFLGEHVGAAFWLSVVVVFAGLCIFCQEELREGGRLRMEMTLSEK